MSDSPDHDLLIRMDAKVTEIHTEMTQPQGRVPRLEKTVEGHAKQINFWRGSIAILAFSLMVIATLLAAHVAGGK